MFEEPTSLPEGESALQPRPVDAVMVTYQSERTLGDALAALKRCHDENLLDLIVVDNGSRDATWQIIEKQAAWARHRISGTNVGFGRGCNVGLQLVTAPFTIFVNPDAIVEPAALRELLDFLLKRPSAGIVGPAIIEGEEGSTCLQRTGPRPTPWSVVKREVPVLDRRSDSWPIIPGADPVRTGWVCGAVLMARTALLKDLNGFDPNFFLYWEETDLCKRAESKNYETWAIGHAVARHVQGASSSFDERKVSGCIGRHFYQSRYYYLTKHHGVLAASMAEVAEFGLLLARTAIDVFRGKGAGRIRPRLEAPLFSMPDGIRK